MLKDQGDKSLPIADCQLPIGGIPVAENAIGNWQLAIGNRQCSYVAD
jgi:hypothetical protein